MPRFPGLPDIPLDGWIKDQQEMFQQNVSGLDDSVQFDDAMSGRVAAIPTADETDQVAELDRKNREWEAQQEESRRLEQQRLQEQQAQAAEQQQQEAERQREEQLTIQARNQASSLGIPSPDSIRGFFSGLLGSSPDTTTPPQPATYGASGDDTSGMAAPAPQPIAPVEQPMYGQPVNPQPELAPQGLPDLQQFSQNVDAISSPMIGPLDPTLGNNIQDWGNRLDTKTNDILTHHIQENLAPTDGRPSMDDIAARNKEVFGQGDILGRILYQGNVPVGPGIAPSVKDLEQGQRIVRMATGVAQSIPEIGPAVLDSILEAPGYSKKDGYKVDVPGLGEVGIADVVIALAPGKGQAIAMGGTGVAHAPGMGVVDIPAARKLLAGEGPILGEATGYGGNNLAGNVEWAVGHDLGAAKDAVVGALGAGARRLGPAVEPLGQAAIDAGSAIDRAGGRGWDELANILSSGAKLAKQYPEATAGLATAAATKAFAPDQTGPKDSLGLGAAVAGGVALTRPRNIAGELEQAPVFFSALRREIEAKVGRRGADPAQILSLIGYKLGDNGEVIRTRQTPVKPEEIKWTGIDDWLKQQTGKVSKQDILDFLDTNQVQVQETVLGKPEYPGSMPEPNWTKLSEDKYAVHLQDHPEQAWTVQVLPPVAEGDFGYTGGRYTPGTGQPQYAIQGVRGNTQIVHSPDEVIQHIQNQVSVDTPTEYGSYTTKGGQNYRELLLTLPAPGTHKYEQSFTELHGAMLRQLDQAGIPHNATNYQVEEVLGPEEAARIRNIRMGIFPRGEGPGTTGDYTGGHWDEPNVLAHVRFDERTDAQGRRILHIDEIQSDWHQEGRRSGYAEATPDPAKTAELQQQLEAARTQTDRAYTAYQHQYNIHEPNYDRPNDINYPLENARTAHQDAQLEENRLQLALDAHTTQGDKPPAGPYEKTWSELAMKRMMRWAADNGFDRVTWEPGETHSNRWTTPRVDWKPADGGGFLVVGRGAVTPGDPLIAYERAMQQQHVTTPEELAQLLKNTYGMYGNNAGPGERELAEGRDLPTKLWQQMQRQPEGSFEPRTAGMAGFYDAALPSTVNDITRKFGSTVQKFDVPDITKEVDLRRRGYRYQVLDRDGTPLQGRQFNTLELAQRDADAFGGTVRDLEQEAVPTRQVWGVDVTPEMKQSVVEQGFPQFAALPPGIAESATGAGVGAGAGAASDNQDDTGPSSAATGALLGIGAVKLARNFPKVWAERLGRGPLIPEGVVAEQAAAIRSAYEATVRALTESLDSRGTQKRMRLRTVANKAYAAYQDAIGGKYDARTPVGTGPYPEGLPPRESPARTGLPETNQPLSDVGATPEGGGAVGSESSYIPGRGASDLGASPTSDTTLSEHPTSGDLSTSPGSPSPDDVAFEQNPLPDTLNPAEPVSRDQLSTFIDTLRNTFSGNDRVTNLINRMVANLARDVAEPRMRHLEQMLETVAQHPSNPQRVLGRQEAPAVEAKTWADNWFRDNGFLAPKPTVDAAPPVEDRTQLLGGYSPMGSTLGAASGATAGAVQGQDDSNDQYEVPVDKMIPGAIAGTIFGRRATRQVLRDAALEADPKLRMFATPTVNQNAVGLIDKAHNFWRNRIIPAVSDDIAALQGFQGDLAKIYHQATGSPLPAEVMAAEMKRFDYSRSYEMTVNRMLKPALQAIDDMDLPLLVSNGKPMDGMGQVDAYLGHMMDMDVARNVGNGMRDFPGQGGSTYGDSLRYTKALEDRILQEKGPQGLQEFKAATQQIWDFGDHILQTLRDGGLIDAQTYTDLRTKYPHYMPTKLVKYLRDGDFVGGGSSRTMSVNSNTLHELTKLGSTDEASSYIASLLGEGRQAYSAAAKNQVYTAFVGMWNEANQLMQQGLIPADRTGRRLTNYAQGIVPVANTYTPRENEATVTGFLGGLKQKFVVSKELGDLTSYASPTVIPVLSGLMAAFRAGATARNPVFLTANMILDLATYMARETAREGGFSAAGGLAGGLAGGIAGTETTKPEDSPLTKAAKVGIGLTAGANAGAAIKPASKVFAAWAMAAKEFFPLATGALAMAGGVGGGLTTNKDDSALTATGKVGAGMLFGGLAGAAIDRKGAGSVLRDIAQHEYRGDMARFLQQGGGTAGGYFDTSLKRADPLVLANQSHPTLQAMQQGLEDIANRFAPDRNKAPLEREIDTLRRQSPIEVHSPADAVRLLKDLALLKPVEALGERIELIPRVASMRLAEGRAAPEINALQSELTQQIQALQNLPPGAQLPGRHPQDISAELADRQWRSQIEGTQAGRTTTIDFNKGGTWSRFINQIIPFFNVGVQAMVDTPRTIAENGWKNTAATLGAAVIAPTIAAEVWNNADPQRAKDYADVPSYIKDQGIVIMLPRDIFPPSTDQQGNEHPQFFHWRERHLAPLTIATREFLQRSLFAGTPSDENRRDWLEAVLGGADQLSPIGGLKNLAKGDPKEFLTNLSPPVVSTATQSAFNEDTFRGARVNSKFADERASPLSQGIAHYTGVRPSTVEFWSRDLLTGYAGMLHGASAILTGKKPETSSDTPLVGGLTGRFVKGSIGEGANLAEAHVVSPTTEKLLKQAHVDWRPAPVDPELDKTPLTRLQLATYQKLTTKAIDEAVQLLSEDTGWQGLDDADKRLVLDRVVGRYRDKARSEFYSQVDLNQWNAQQDKALSAR